MEQSNFEDTRQYLEWRVSGYRSRLHESNKNLTDAKRSLALYQLLSFLGWAGFVGALCAQF